MMQIENLVQIENPDNNNNDNNCLSTEDAILHELLENYLNTFELFQETEYLEVIMEKDIKSIEEK